MSAPSSGRLAAALALSLLFVGGGAGSARADDLWRQRGEDCDRTAFRKPQDTSLKKIGRCVRLWEAYKDAGDVRGKRKATVVKAMERLYVEGSKKDAHVARRALVRLGVTRLPQRPNHKAPIDVVGPHGGAEDGGRAASSEEAEGGEERPRSRGGKKTCDVPEPSKAEVKSAERAFKKGYTQYKKKRYDKALDQYLQAVKAAPGWAKGRYNAASAHALLEEEEAAVKQLVCMSEIESDQSAAYLKKARKDPDFVPIRDDSKKFKQLTGYARIKIGNGLGEYGEDNVDNLEASMEELGFPIEEVTETRKTYKEPHIWYKKECAFPAYMLIEVMNHPSTKTHEIDWKDEPFDVIVAWGDRIKKGEEPRLRVKDPEDAERKLDDLARKEDEILRKPEQGARKVEHVVETPDRVTKKVEGSVDRAEKTVDRLEKTGKTLEGLVP